MKRFLVPVLAGVTAFAPSIAAAHHEGVTGAESVASLAVALAIGIALVVSLKR